ncbi:glycogen synthase [Kitasatospora cystarginea]|uniref:D-inositol 3-phosphate glycosyltransferase n=1 Tax=Kitasatospora cystarginea TaxID=58350 RepID=A0ABP5RP76_9ACTN
MRVDLLTREYPPEVYGGAGVHAAELTRALRRRAEVWVRCFGVERTEPGTRAYPLPGELHEANAALRFLGAGLRIAADCAGADVVHSHTWYANAAGQVAGRLHGIPHVMTMHSLEPLRPWKAEQLGGGYSLSSWMERASAAEADALIAVSAAMRDDILAVYPGIPPERVHVIHNGIDGEVYRPDLGTAALTRFGIDPDRPIVVFVGRVTRQKGLPHLLRAAFRLPPEAQLVLCCGQPDTPEIAAEVAGLVEELTRVRQGVFRIDEMLDGPSVRQLLTRATVFVCPSLYEPMGIVNLEAMACETAVVATAVGGIPEVVEGGRTGLLVDYEPRPDGTGEPADPDRLARDLADSVNRLIEDPELARKLGRAGRERALREFSWHEVATRTLAVYRALTAAP